MILPILVTALAVVALLFIGTFRRPTKELITVASLLGIYILQSAHVIFMEAEDKIQDHQYVVSASFIILFIPLIIQYQQQIIGCLQSRLLCKGLLAVAFILAAVLYLKASLNPGMGLYSYAPFIWGMSFLLLTFACLRKAIFFPETQKNPEYNSKLSGTLKFLLLVIFTPPVITLLTTIFPGDNFLLPYKPLISEAKTVYLVSAVLLIVFIVRLVELRKLFHSTIDKRNQKKVTGLAW